MKTKGKFAKKFLSVFLSVLMVFSAMSVMFTAFAALSADTLTKLSDALKSDLVEDLSTYTTVDNKSTGSGSNVIKTNTTTIELKTYAKYEEMLNILTLLNQAIEETEEFRKYEKFNSADNGNVRNCSNVGCVRAELTSELQSDNYMGGSGFAKYNVATFFDNVFSMTGVSYYHDSDCKSTTDNKNCPARVYDITEIKTDDYQGYLKTVGSRADVPDDIVLGAKLTLTMTRENYQTGSIFRKTNHYHNAFNSSTEAAKKFEIGTLKNSEVKATLNEYDEYLDGILAMNLTYDDMLGMVKDNKMDDFKGTFDKKLEDIVKYVGGVDVFNKLYADRLDTIDQLGKSMESAMDLEIYMAIADDYNAYVADPEHPYYGDYKYGGFDYDTMVADYAVFMEVYNKLLGGSKEMIDYLDREGVIDLSYYTNFTDNVKVYDLAATGEKANALYNDVKDVYADFVTEEAEAVYATLTGYINVIKTYNKQVKDDIFPTGYAYLIDLQEKLNCKINENVVFFTENTKVTLADSSADAIIAVIDAIPANTDGLNEFYASLAAATSNERAEQLLGATVAAAAVLRDDLLDLLAENFITEVKVAKDLYIALGQPTTINLQTASKLSVAFDRLEDNILPYLEEAGKADLVPEETVAAYNWLRESVYSKYMEYLATFGLSTFEKTEIEYESREVYINDKVKTEAYDVTEENLLNIVEKLDKFLGGDTFKDLIGGKGLDTMLPELIEKIYTDDIVNFAVQYLYPLVANEFVKVWATLPTSITVNVPNVIAGMSADVVAGLDLMSVEDAMEAIGLYLFPAQLANHIKAEYPDYSDAADVLAKCTTKASLTVNPWEDKQLLNEDGKLALEWGVTDRESFVNALSVALSGLEPLLLALLANREMSLTNNIGTGSGSAQVSFVTVNLKIDPITLNLTASGNSGYNNTVAPIIEMLGETAPNGDEFTSMAQIIDDGVLTPIYSLLDKIANAPVDTVLSVLPNLVYALSTNMVPSLLKMLKTDINYSADAVYDASVAKGTLTGAMKSENPIKINVGDMLDISSIKINDKPLDLTDINGLIAMFGLDIPALDTVTIATAGTLGTMDTVRTEWIYDNSAIGGKAYTIESDKADLGYYVLTYVADLLQDREALAGILSMFLDENAIATVNTVLDTLNIEDTGDLIAAVVELLNAEKYPELDFVYPPVDNSVTIVAEDYYSDYWSAEQAKYVSDNLVPLIEKICDLIGIDYVQELTDLVTNLYTHDNVVSLVELVNGILDKLLVNETVVDVLNAVNPLLSINVMSIINELQAYEVPEFEDGDRDAFVSAIVDYVEPIVPVLKLFLLGDSSLSLVDDLVKINGYNGYNSALIPILEAVGCKVADITPYDKFKTLDDRAMVEAVLEPILLLVDNTLAENPINNIVKLLPNILYFIDNGGLQQAVDNILRPVYVVLDVIRPIYDIDLTINLNLNEILTDLLASATKDLSFKFPGYTELSSVIKLLGTAETYTSATGKEAVRLNADESFTPEFVTALLRTLVKTVLFSDNVSKIMEYVKENSDLSDEAIADLENMLQTFIDAKGTDMVLSTMSIMFFGANIGADAAIAIRGEIADQIVEALKKIGLSSSDEFREVVATITDALESIAGSADTIIGNENKDNSFVAFFKKIGAFVKKVIDMFLALFKM